MKPIPIPMNHWTHDEWTAALSQLDYAPTPTGDAWRHNGVAFKTSGDWSLVEDNSHPAPADRLRGVIGRPGFWKHVTDNGRSRHVFELPTHLLLDTDEDDFTTDEARPLLADALTWAQATVDGGLPEGWRPPPREKVEAWIPKGRLTVQHGAIVRQGELVHAPDCLALRVPVLPVLPADLPELNTRFLEQILLEATDRWRLVRLGIVDDGEALAVIAEVNFTGASAPVIERLILASLASLHWTSLWLAESAELLADVAVTPRALALCGVGQSNTRKEQTP
ncbi:MAG TPA: hypothetical protein VGK40_10030 [Verrucomicrobiae bacterium]|jgi:hypothetical protein